MTSEMSFSETSTLIRNQLIRSYRSGIVFANRGWEYALTRTGLVDRVNREFREQSAHLPRAIAAEVEFAYGFHSLGVSIAPIQEKTEITSLLLEVERIQPRNVLDLGTWNGGTLFLFSRVSRPDANIVSLDLPARSFGGGYSEWRKTLFHSFPSSRQTVHLILGDSHESATLSRVTEALHNEPLDFLFIDADHKYPGVKLDFETYSPLVRAGGIVAFHDIASDNPKIGIEVHRFWNEIKDQYRHLELITCHTKWGIGVLLV